MSADPLEYLFSLEQFGIKFGLDNMRAIVGALGHPERAFASVHIAGTNGKGSVTAMVDAMLRAAGHRAARYTSPHLVDLTERFVIDGVPVTSAALQAAVERVRAAVLSLQDRGSLQTHPTFFEVTTAAAFELFRHARVGVAVCETGLGGRLDATNVIRPIVTAITSIALDHEQYLGHRLEDIAAEKAGIIKPGVPVVCGELQPAARLVIEQVARERDAPLIRAYNGVVLEADNLDSSTSQICLSTPARTYGRLDLALAGRHQVDNAVVAVRIVELLNGRGMTVPREAVADGLRRVHWPGRLQRLQWDDGRELLLDAAHNPAGAAALATFLAAGPKKRPLVFAAMKDKDLRGIIATLVPVAGALVITRASHPRSADPRVIAELVHEHDRAIPVSIAASPADAVASAWRLDRTIVAAGSIFLLGDVLKALGRS